MKSTVLKKFDNIFTLNFFSKIANPLINDFKISGFWHSLSYSHRSFIQNLCSVPILQYPWDQTRVSTRIPGYGLRTEMIRKFFPFPLWKSFQKTGIPERFPEHFFSRKTEKQCSRITDRYGIPERSGYFRNVPEYHSRNFPKNRSRNFRFSKQLVP